MKGITFVSELLGNSKNCVFITDIPESELPHCFCSFFDKKRKEKRISHLFAVNPTHNLLMILAYHFFVVVGSELCSCEPVLQGFVLKLICDFAPKGCVLDPVSTTSLKTYLGDYVPFDLQNCQ